MQCRPVSLELLKCYRLVNTIVHSIMHGWLVSLELLECYRIVNTIVHSNMHGWLVPLQLLK